MEIYGTELNEGIKELAKKYNKKNGYGEELEELVESIVESKCIWKSKYDEHRHWSTFTKVVKFEGKFIGFEWATTSDDMAIWDKGFEFDVSSITEMQPKEITTVVYKEDV